MRIATMKAMPTDEEVEDAGCEDGGEMLLAMSPYERRNFATSNAATWDTELRQPIWREYTARFAHRLSHAACVLLFCSPPLTPAQAEPYAYRLPARSCSRTGAVHHLIMLMVRSVESVSAVLTKQAAGPGDMKLSRKEVQVFKKKGGMAGADSGSPGP